MVRSRPAVWQRILINLLGNAMKYTYSGCIEIELTIAAPDVVIETQIVTLIVRDTGKGMSQSYLNHHLYQPFVQEDTLSPGTGLGLSIVKGLVSEVQGSVSMRSAKNIGTEATIRIPMIFLEEIPAVPPSRSLGTLSICLFGLNLHPDYNATTMEEVSADVRRVLALRKSLASTCKEWLGLELSEPNQCSEANEADIVFILEDDFETLKHSPSVPGMLSLETLRNCVLIVLCTEHTLRQRLTHHENMVGLCYLTQPFGPLQVTSVVTQAQALVAGNRTGWHRDFKLRRAGSDELEPVSKTTAAMTGLSNEDAGNYVLLVEDNMVNLQLLVRSMEKIGRKFLTATNGQQALDIYRARSMEIEHIFMDVSMPVMDGFTATREIRAFERQKGSARKPITLVTGLGSEAARREAESCGSDQFIVKPVRLSLLRALLARV